MYHFLGYYSRFTGLSSFCFSKKRKKIPVFEWESNTGQTTKASHLKVKMFPFHPLFSFFYVQPSLFLRKSSHLAQVTAAPLSSCALTDEKLIFYSQIKTKHPDVGQQFSLSDWGKQGGATNFTDHINHFCGFSFSLPQHFFHQQMVPYSQVLKPLMYKNACG